MPNDTLESANGQGAQPEPQASASGASSGSQPSSVPDVSSELAKLNRRLDGIERMAQGDKDRAVANVRKEFESWKPVLEKVAAMTGMTPEQAAAVQREMEYDEIKRRVFEQPSAQPAAQATGGVDIAQKAMKKYGLSDTDPEVVSIMRDIPDAEERAFKLAELGAVRKSAPQPTPGAAPAPIGGTPPRPDLAAEYANKLQSVRGNVLAIAELKKEYRKKGLEVW